MKTQDLSKDEQKETSGGMVVRNDMFSGGPVSTDPTDPTYSGGDEPTHNPTDPLPPQDGGVYSTGYPAGPQV